MPAQAKPQDHQAKTTRVSANVLRNKGVPVDLAEVEEGEVVDGVARPRRVLQGNGSPKTRTVHVRVDNNILAELEERYGSLAEFQETMGRKPHSTLRSVLAIVLERPEREVGVAMLDGKLNDYSTAVGGAISISQGVDPTKVVKMIELGVEAVAAAEAKRDAALEKMFEGDSPGTNGSAPSSAPDEASPSSGA